MTFYWSDREGNPPPLNSILYARPFFSNKTISFSKQRKELPPPATYQVLKKTFLPSRKVWFEKVNQALELIRQRQLQKVVLARACILELNQEPDPFAITAALKEKAQGAFIFCLQSPSESFLGATPERLFARKKNQIFTEALAGTRKRGTTPLQDEELARELLSSPKDLQEFSYIPAHLHTTLSPLCIQPPQFSPFSVHKTANVQHLYSSASAYLKNPFQDEEIISALHPTPALCGTPQAKAHSFIQEQEPFDRNLYGGVIGWSTSEASEWVVGIRSCLIRGKQAILFSGTGIVEGSDPEAEWEELDQKIKLYENSLSYECNI